MSWHEPDWLRQTLTLLTPPFSLTPHAPSKDITDQPTMSNPTTTPSSSERNITRYSQAISSNLANLMSELARASAPVPPSNEDIFRQLLIITEQLNKVNQRLDALEQASSTLLNHATANVVPVEVEDELAQFFPLTVVYVPIVVYFVSCSSYACIVSTTPEHACTTPLPAITATRCFRCTTATTKGSWDSRPPSAILPE